MSAPNAAVVAVQDGRIVKLGSSRKLGKYVILRDVYGDVFTYAGLGSIAPSYRLPKAPAAPRAGKPRRPAASEQRTGALAARERGRQPPLTLKVKAPAHEPAKATAPQRARRPPGRPPPARCGCSPIPAIRTPRTAASAPCQACAPRAAPVAALRRARSSPEGHRARPRAHAAPRARRSPALRDPPGGRSAARSTRGRSCRTGLSSGRRCTRRAPAARPTCSARPPAEPSCSPRASSSVPCSPIPASASTPAAARTSHRARSTSACWRCSRSSRAAG